MTKLIAAMTAEHWPEMVAEARAALAAGADLVELRLDCLTDLAPGSVPTVPDDLRGKVIVTLRPTDEGGRFDGDEADRVSMLLAAARGAEAYAPLHEYEFKGKGAVKGEPFAVLRVRERMSANDAFRVEDVKIRH